LLTIIGQEAFFSFIHRDNIGNKTNIRRVDEIIPPITTFASGHFTFSPIPMPP